MNPLHKANAQKDDQQALSRESWGLRLLCGVMRRCTSELPQQLCRDIMLSCWTRSQSCYLPISLSTAFQAFKTFRQSASSR